MEPTLEYIQQVRRQLWNTVEYTDKENLFKDRITTKNAFLASHPVTFFNGSMFKAVKSCFGTFLQNFNLRHNQTEELNQNKLGIFQYNVKELNDNEKEILKIFNDYVDNAIDLLEQTVEKTDYIDCEYLCQNFDSYRLVNSYVNSVDDGLQHLQNLKVLILVLNYIKELPGKYLPKTDRFLELFANEIEDVGPLCEGAPKKILHLGLGRNKLTNDSKLHLLSKSGNFKYLRTLDLSDNDIYSLLPLLEVLQNLRLLRGLYLEGNPCSTCICYKDAVLKYFPKLYYLDGVEILEKDRTLNKYEIADATKAFFVFTCHRLIGLPQPPKEKGAQQTFHFEINLPLLQEIKIDLPEVEEEEEVENKANKKKGKGKGKDKGSGKKSKNSSKKSGKGKGKAKFNPYSAPDEYEEQRKAKIKDVSCKTLRMPWSKVIEFPEEAMCIESQEQDLKTIRDTFRSNVQVKLVYLKFLPPDKQKGKNKPKKSKGKDKGKGKGKSKDKGSKKGKNKDKGSKSEKDEKLVKLKEPTETILKKITIASFICQLKPVNWSNKTNDYYWALHPKIGSEAISVEGSLKAINYIEGKKGKKGGKKKEKASSKKSKKSNKSSQPEPESEPDNLTRVPSKQFLPDILTLQLGFGLKRSYTV